MLLLIACGNIASLMLARFLNRQQEMSIRLALGAGRSAIMAPILTESTLLALTSGALGLFFAKATAPVLAMLTAKESLTIPVQLNWHVLIFLLTLSLSCSIPFGIVPALQLSQTACAASFLSVRGGKVDRKTMRGSRFLVVFEISLSVVVVVSATLLIRSFVSLRSVPLGFDPDRVLTMRVTLSPSKYSSPQQILTLT